MKQDFIKITGLEIYGHHGVYEEENLRGQTFVVNAKLYYNMEAAASGDNLDAALNYAGVCGYMNRLLRERRFQLLEAAAKFLARRLMLDYPVLECVEIELCKPMAPIGLPFQNVSVNTSCGWHKVYLSVGSNMGDKRQIILDAVEKLKQCEDVRNLVLSDLIETEPYGYTEQDLFVNGAIGMETLYTPHELLNVLHGIEQDAGRERIIRWGPRTLDLDILLYEREILDDQELTIPHLDMENRDFVLRPLEQIAPGAVHPIAKKTVRTLLADLESKQSNAAQNHER